MDEKTVLYNAGNNSPPIVSLDVLKRDAVLLGCVSDQEFSTIVPSDADKGTEHETIATTKELVRRGKMTPFQAKFLLTGNARALSLGPYLVLDKIGQGGMGSVYRARHQRMQRIVAVKVLNVKGDFSSDLIKRFQRETQAAAKLIHPNIVTAFDAGEDEKKHFLVMEYVDGQDLKSVLERSGPLSVRDAVDYTIQAARGLQYAHEQSIIHRDIKPANLLLDKAGCIKVLDMGLARIEENAGIEQLSIQELTADGTVMGTMDYMSPEQGTDTRSADTRSDIYSLGCTIYTLLTREPMYPGGSIFQKITAHRENPIPSVRARRPDVPLELERVISRMVAKKPDDRPQTMSEVIQQLELAMSNRDTTASGDPVLPTRSDGNPSTLETIVAKTGNTKLDLSKAKTTASSKGSISSIERLKAKKKARRRKEILVVAGIAVALLVGSLGYFAASRRSQPLAQTKKPSDKTAIQTPKSSPPPPATGGSAKPLEAKTNVLTPVEPNKVPTGATAETSSQPSSAGVAEPGVPETIESKGSTSKGSTSTIEVTPETVAEVKEKMAEADPEKVAMPEAPKDITMPEPGVAKGSPLDKATGWNGWDTGKGAPQPAIVPFNAKTAAKLQEQWAKYYKVPPTFTNRIGIVFVLIPPGEFEGGFTDEELDQLASNSDGLLSREGLKDQPPKQRIVIPKPFYISVFEVTNKQFFDLMGVKPSELNDQTLNHPVYTSYASTIRFCNDLSVGHHLNMAYRYSTNMVVATDEIGYRLPTEFEWEFAARAGANSRYWCDEDKVLWADWFLQNSSGLQAVGLLARNPFGLYDVQGNAREFVLGYNRGKRELFSEGYFLVDSVAREDASGTLIRGGDYSMNHWLFHLSRPTRYGPEFSPENGTTAGFRVAIDVEAMRKK